MPVVPTRFSIEHIPRSMSPSGVIDSAPKEFVVLGMRRELDPNPVELGRSVLSRGCKGRASPRGPAGGLGPEPAGFLSMGLRAQY